MFAPGPFVIPARALPVIREFVWVRPLLLLMCTESLRSTTDYANGDMGENSVALLDGRQFFLPNFVRASRNT